MNQTVLSLVEQALRDSGISAELATDQQCLGYLQSNRHFTVDYHPQFINYQQAYLNFNREHAFAFKLRLKQGDRTCGMFHVMVKNYPEAPAIGSNAGHLLPPLLNEDLSRKQKRRFFSGCLHFTQTLMTLLSITEINSQFIFHSGLSEPWLALFIDQGRVPQFSQELYCDLRLNDVDYLKQIRDRYRSQIKKAESLWQVTVKTMINDQELQAFQQLHRQVAGKQTRSDLSWQLQMSAVNHQAAFMVFAYHKDTQSAADLVGAALFNYTPYQASYAVGAYDRSLFDQPVSHLIHYKAIEYMKTLGLSWYHIGARANDYEWTNPTEKESQIGYFKEGFATHSLFRVMI